MKSKYKLVRYNSFYKKWNAKIVRKDDYGNKYNLLNKWLDSEYDAAIEVDLCLIDNGEKPVNIL